jgi:hypothetical protein
MGEGKIAFVTTAGQVFLVANDQVMSKRPTGVLLYIGKIHAILAVWNQSIRKFV